MSIFYIIIIALAVIGGVSALLHFVNNKQNQLDAKVSNREVVQLAEEFGGKVTVAALARARDLTTSEAKTKLYSMMNQGVFNYKVNADLQEEFTLSNPVKDALKGNREPNSFTKYSTKKTNDSEIIKLAANSDGKLTSAMLCIEAEISIDQAKKMLDNLQEKGVFEVKVNNDGVIIYELIDTELLKKYGK